jgi:diguanylate cyclase (GGDEF)-like protein
MADPRHGVEPQPVISTVEKVISIVVGSVPIRLNTAIMTVPTDPNVSGNVLRSDSVDCLLRVIQDLSRADDLPNIQQVIKNAARELTGSDGATFILRERDQCHYVDEEAISPLWKGRRFAMTDCISGWTMLNRRPAVVPDIYADDRVPHEAYRPTFVRSLAVVPIRQSDPIGAIGSYWATPRRPGEEEIRFLQALADSASIAIEKVRNDAELKQANHEISQLSITDELTGLHNRRGLFVLSRQELQRAARWGRRCLVAFIDIDNLKLVNDSLGHRNGDEMISAMAGVLRATFRRSDVLARIGGDEFCVLALEPDNSADILKRRLNDRIDEYNRNANARHPLVCSVGIVEAEVDASVRLDDLLARADAEMYAEKLSKAARRG